MDGHGFISGGITHPIRPVFWRESDGPVMDKWYQNQLVWETMAPSVTDIGNPQQRRKKGKDKNKDVMVLM